MKLFEFSVTVLQLWHETNEATGEYRGSGMYCKPSASIPVCPNSFLVALALEAQVKASLSQLCQSILAQVPLPPQPSLFAAPRAQPLHNTSRVFPLVRRFVLDQLHQPLIPHVIIVVLKLVVCSKIKAELIELVEISTSCSRCIRWDRSITAYNSRPAPHLVISPSSFG